jgi:hypothetical protein
VAPYLLLRCLRRHSKTNTKKSRRSIRLTPRAVETLREHLERQLREIDILGDRYEDQGLLFTTDTGGPINPSNLRRRRFAPLLKKARLPRIRFHDLRHTCATLLLSRGTHPKYVQELLGHATVAMTLDTYSLPRPTGHGRPDRTRHAGCSLLRGGRADLRLAALVSGWCQKRPEETLAVCLGSAFCAAKRLFFSGGPAWTRTRDLFLIREAL